MKIRIMVAVFFDTATEAQQVLAQIPKPLRKLFAKDDSFVQIHKCYHDESPTKPCVLIKEWRPSE